VSQFHALTALTALTALIAVSFQFSNRTEVRLTKYKL
jgi:hypothetical protein